MKLSLKIGYGIVLIAGAGYGVYELRGQHGVAALMEKRQEIRLLEQQNQQLHRENEAMKARAGRLLDNPEEQELEIRRRLKLVRPGEKSFIMQEGKEPGGR